VAKKSSRRSAQPALIQNTSGETGNASVAEGKEPICGICGNEEGYTDHFKPSPRYHAFETGKKKASAA
jgi:hypothetical protein